MLKITFNISLAVATPLCFTAYQYAETEVLVTEVSPNQDEYSIHPYWSCLHAVSYSRMQRLL